MTDLLVVVPDVKWKAVIEAILARPASLGVRQPVFEIVDWPGRDGGVRANLAAIARLHRGRCEHVLAVFDWDGCGSKASPHEIQKSLDAALAGDWQNRGRAIVVDREIETWVIGAYQHFGILSRRASEINAREWFAESGLWPLDTAKPKDAKSAVERFFRHVGAAPNAANYRKLASKASLSLEADRCDSFRRFVQTLRAWFAPDGPDCCAAMCS